MRAAVLAARAHDDAPIMLRREERLAALFMPIRDMSPVMVLFVVASLAIHAGLLATAVVAGRAPLVMPKEIAVEVVQEVPKAALKETPKEIPPPPVAPVKPPEPAKAAMAPPADPQKQPAPPPPQPQQKPATPDLAKELEALRAEQAKLKSELAAAPAEEAAATKAGAASGKAVALATAGDGDGDPVGYQQLVFSQLAKAKDGDGFKGAVGTTGVRFEIAATGELARVEVVTPSGDASLDKEAVAIVGRAAPFPPPPKDADRIVFANVNFVGPKRP